MRKTLELLALTILLLAGIPALAGTADESPAAAPDAAPDAAAELAAPAPQPAAAGLFSPAAAAVPEPLWLSEQPPPGGCAYRWVIGGGCCNLAWGYAWREKEQKNCGGGWVDTGATRCTNYPCG